MKQRKLLAVMLSLAMLCGLLSGCVYVNSEATIHKDGSGTVTFASGMLADEETELEEGQEIFEANGKQYYGKSETYDFSSVEEFNKLFVPGEDGAIVDNDNVRCELRKNSDGSMTLVLFFRQEEETEESEESEETEESEEKTVLSPEEEQQLEEATEAMIADAYMHYSFQFDQPIRQLSGPTDAVTIDGVSLMIDLLKQAKEDTDSTYVFITDVASAVVPSKQALKIDGELKEAEIYNINGSNYFKLRDMAALLSGSAAQFSVDYDGTSGTVQIKTGEAYTSVKGDLTMPDAEKAASKAAGAVKSAQSLTINGEPTYLAPYNIGGNNYFALRDLGSALGFGVDYDGATATMLVTTSAK